MKNSHTWTLATLSLCLAPVGCDDAGDFLGDHLSADGSTHVYEVGADGSLTTGAVLEEDLHGGSFAALPDGRVAVMGMTGLTPDNRGNDHVRIYDPASDTWSVGASWPTRFGVEWLTLGERVCGGSGEVNGENGELEWSDAVDCYDPATDSWHELAPSPVRSMSMVEYAGKLYAFDTDRDDEDGTTAAAVYDPDTDSWSPIADKPVCPEGDAVVVDDLIYLVGCGAGSFGVYDPVADSWETGSDPQGPLFGPHSTVVLDKTVHLASGKVHTLDTTAMTWTEVSAAPGDGIVGIALVSDRLHALDLEDGFEMAVYTRDDMGAWSRGDRVPDHPGLDAAHGFVSTGDRLFIVIPAIGSVGLQ